MREGPVDGFPASGLIVGDGIVEGKFEAALGGIGDGFDAGLEIEPAGGLAVAVALEAAEALRGKKELWRVLGWRDGSDADRGNAREENDAFQADEIILGYCRLRRVRPTFCGRTRFASRI